MKVIVVLAILFGAANTARILGFFYHPAISHQFVFQAIVRELSLRGHEVTFLTTNPINDPKLTNLTEVDLGFTYQLYKNTDSTKFSRKSLNFISLALYGQQFTENLISMEMETAAVKDILRKPQNSYDLILIEAMTQFFYGIQHKFKAPLIAVSSYGLLTSIHEILGNPVHPFLYPDMISEYLSPVTKIWEKIDSLFIHVLFHLGSNFYVMPRFDKMARHYFGNDMPYLEYLINNASLVFGNVNPIFSDRRPLVPNIKEVWNIHTKESKPLPGDLQKILDGAKNGVVYFSLGTNVRFEHVEVNMKEEVLKALGELPYTVLCKWESEDSPNRPKNVILRKWLPQQSILAHPNVKVFVTQGGLQSSEEAITNGVPLVIIPFLGDQPLNAKILTSRGMGETVLPQSITKDLLRDTILKVAKDEKYRLKAQELRSIFLDQPRTGLEEIVWWCEYVIRHKGAKHLRSPGADIPLYEYFMLDVLAVILIVLFVTYKVIRLVLGALIGLLRGKKTEKVKEN